MPDSQQARNYAARQPEKKQLCGKYFRVKLSNRNLPLHTRERNGSISPFYEGGTANSPGATNHLYENSIQNGYDSSCISQAESSWPLFSLGCLRALAPWNKPAHGLIFLFKIASRFAPRESFNFNRGSGVAFSVIKKLICKRFERYRGELAVLRQVSRSSFPSHTSLTSFKFTSSD